MFGTAACQIKSQLSIPVKPALLPLDQGLTISIEQTAKHSIFCETLSLLKCKSFVDVHLII